MRLLIITLLLISFANLSAQNGWDWGDDKPTAARKHQYVRTYMQSKKYVECRPTVHWLIINTPNLNEDLYKRASVVYKESVKVEADPQKKIALQDSVLWIYDTWMEKFGGVDVSPSLFNKKAKVYYKYYKKRNSFDLGELEIFYEMVLDTVGGAVYSKNIEYYMAIVIKRKMAKEISDDHLFEAYSRAINSVGQKKELKKGNQAELDKLVKVETKITNSLIQSVSLECQSIVDYFKPFYVENPQDFDLANSIRLLLDKNGCDDLSFYLDVVKHISKHEPTAARYTYIGDIELKNNNIDSAVYYLNKASEVETSQENRSKTYYQLATIARKKGKKAESRSYAKKMIGTGYDQSKAYSFIGDLYFYSNDDCQSDDELIARSIYIAAYLQYEKAADAKRMEMAKAQFPSMEDIFSQSKHEGEIVNTGCWIKEDVPLKKR